MSDALRMQGICIAACPRGSNYRTFSASTRKAAGD
jgi:hypothetical protein